MMLYSWIMVPSLLQSIFFVVPVDELINSHYRYCMFPYINKYNMGHTICSSSVFLILPKS